MATMRQKIMAEHKVRAMLEREGVQPPDRVEYAQACIRMMWDAPMVALVVDIDEVVGADPDELERIDVFPQDG